MAKASGYEIHIQERDIAVLHSLLESRIATLAHITTLHFDSKEAAKKRLQKLKAAELVGERERNLNEPSVLFLTKKALKLLENDGHLDSFPKLSTRSFDRRAKVSTFTVRHELEVLDVKAAFYRACRDNHHYSLSHFFTWPAKCQFISWRPEEGEVLVRPDGYLRIQQLSDGIDERGHAFFLEVDRSTETQDILVTKCAGYMQYYRSGGFAVRNGGCPDDYKTYPFRVLLVLKTAERRNNAALLLAQLNPPILTQVWLTTFREVVAQPFGRIWVRPIDCQNALRGTTFEAPRSTGNYRRQSEREAFIESRIAKLGLF